MSCTILFRPLLPVFFGVLLFCTCPAPLHAATLVAIVSERNASDVAHAAQVFHNRHPQHRLVFRTSAQVDALSDAELRALIGEGDALLFATVFKEAAQRIVPMLGTTRAGEIIALAGAPDLGRQSRWRGQRLFTNADARYDELSSLTAEKDASAAAVASAVKRHTSLAPWIRARGYWQNRGESNLISLFALMLSEKDSQLATKAGPIEDAMPLRFRYGGTWFAPNDLRIADQRQIVAILDDQFADGSSVTESSEALCRAIEKQKLGCLNMLASWGKASSDALDVLQQRVGKKLGAIVSVQDFIIGGSSDRANATRLINALDVPVFKAIRLPDVTADAWHLSEQGLAWDSVYYRVAMPELQGIGQPFVIATAAPARLDPLTGIEISTLVPMSAQVETLARRASRWIHLQNMANAQKRVAIVYYNHPPGRHNIGADNLDVPASLLEILQSLKRSGYNTGALPETPAALLAMLQQDGVNLPEQGDALHAMASRVTTVTTKQYTAWLASAPKSLQQEMSGGPLSLLRSNVKLAQSARLPQEARGQVSRTLKEVKHLVEGAQHPARARALDLLAQLEQAYESSIARGVDDPRIDTLNRALYETGIEGLRGWSEPPGNVMVDEGRIVLPGLRFGNVFVGPQPPRGWELNEELLHANTSIPPTHQYLAFYFWLRNEFEADAIVHLGRHSTYEFLPRKGVGLDEQDYSTLIAGDTPGIYPYIVDGVGEGLQAKRRGLAVMIDHLIPPLSTTPLYDDLLRLRQLVESYESASNPALRTQAATAMRALIDKLKLREALTASMDAELKVRGISFDQADDELLVHEIGHYLTKLQEDFMPLGLHVFGKPWSADAVKTMLASMQAGSSGGTQTSKNVRDSLVSSPAHEMAALLHALNGRFVPAGPGNDPIRNPEALPTGRNFHGLDNSLLPSKLGFALGEQLATQARAKVTPEGKEAVVLWASDSVRDEGAMVAFGLALLRVTPEWNSRGIVVGLKRQPLGTSGVRADTVFVTSGLFRDLFGQQIVWLDKAVLLALDGSRKTIEASYPQLARALGAALAPLGPLANAGNEPLARNYVARHWVTEAAALMKSGQSAEQAGMQASLRVFGTAPGDYGAGINRLAERSGSWTDRKELAQVYMDRIGHAYAADGTSAPRRELLQSNLREVRNTYLGRASNLYGLMDNNDAFDYLGGLSLAVESVSGRVPASHVANHSSAVKPEMEPLQEALVSELRGRYLNPAWIKPLMKHGYAGARTMGSEFMEYLWGWQVTNPDIIKSWAWDEVKSVYIDDRYQLQLDKFLEQDSNVHVKTNMMAILLVAAEKKFWQTDEATLRKLSQAWVDLLLKNGLPGSGHTRPDHPVFQWVQPYLRDDQRAPLKALLDKARVTPTKVQAAPTTISELQPADAAALKAAAKSQAQALNAPTPSDARDSVAGAQPRAEAQGSSDLHRSFAGLIALVLLFVLVAGGFVRGRFSHVAR